MTERKVSDFIRRALNVSSSQCWSPPHFLWSAEGDHSNKQERIRNAKQLSFLLIGMLKAERPGIKLGDGYFDITWHFSRLSFSRLCLLVGSLRATRLSGVLRGHTSLDFRRLFYSVEIIITGIISLELTGLWAVVNYTVQLLRHIPESIMAAAVYFLQSTHAEKKYLVSLSGCIHHAAAVHYYLLATMYNASMVRLKAWCKFLQSGHESFQAMESFQPSSQMRDERYDRAMVAANCSLCRREINIPQGDAFKEGVGTAVIENVEQFCLVSLFGILSCVSSRQKIYLMNGVMLQSVLLAVGILASECILAVYCTDSKDHEGADNESFIQSNQVRAFKFVDVLKLNPVAYRQS
ncbi:hypothetical protein SELMODRAFT_409752 [Selaginella moellendorffii]|uniref:Uncharacterized protein n=1 Tax=Selaginella moellendorffii TaxID=88036 RepID=D8RCC0_SELML|nr:hypothetical protein SELMODRAFT_409752 [Selaginella moellendorffii]